MTKKPKSISEVCKLFKDCPFCWDCLYEIALTGSALWSVEICYDLKELIDAGLVEQQGLTEAKIAYGMRSTFHLPRKQVAL